MRAKKPLFIALIALALLLILCGCADMAVECGLDEQNVATLSYHVLAHRGETAAAEWTKAVGLIRTIQSHWQKAGFETDIVNNDRTAELTAVMRQEEKSRQKAFEALLAMMRSEASPFTDVSGDYSESYFSDEYYLSASCDFSGIIPGEVMDTLPYNIEADVRQLLEDSSVVVRLSLPGEVVETSGQKTADGCEITAGFSGPAGLFVRTRHDNPENIAEYEGMLGGRELSKKLVIGGAALAVLSLFGFITALAARGRAARHNRLAAHLGRHSAAVPIDVPSQIDSEDPFR